MKKQVKINRKGLLRLISVGVFLNVIILSSSLFCSCQEQSLGTDVEISLKNILGQSLNTKVAPTLTVYEYDSVTWELEGDKKVNAKDSIKADSFGVAKFTIENTYFTNPQMVLYYSCHYEANGEEKSVNVKVTLMQGDRVRKELVLK